MLGGAVWEIAYLDEQKQVGILRLGGGPVLVLSVLVLEINTLLNGWGASINTHRSDLPLNTSTPANPERCGP
jgi:hypothetical protein